MNVLRIGLAAAAITAFAGAGHAFELKSSSIGADGKIPLKYVANIIGCTGQNVSPAVSWSNPPAGTKSFALTVYDPDAPTGSGFWHWLVVNIPPTVAELPEGAGSAGGKLPAGAVQGRGDVGMSSYLGPCPPQGDAPHHYVYTLYALSTDKLDADQNSSGALIGFMIHYATIDKASATFTYGR